MWEHHLPMACGEPLLQEAHKHRRRSPDKQQAGCSLLPCAPPPIPVPLPQHSRRQMINGVSFHNQCCGLSHGPALSSRQRWVCWGDSGVLTVRSCCAQGIKEKGSGEGSHVLPVRGHMALTWISIFLPSHRVFLLLPQYQKKWCVCAHAHVRMCVLCTCEHSCVHCVCMCV